MFYILDHTIVIVSGIEPNLKLKINFLLTNLNKSTYNGIQMKTKTNEYNLK